MNMGADLSWERDCLSLVAMIGVPVAAGLPEAIGLLEVIGQPLQQRQPHHISHSSKQQQNKGRARVVSCCWWSGGVGGLGGVGGWKWLD